MSTISATTDTLYVAETFYSLQGEGMTGGCPAVFLRLQHCNLLCGRGKASWRCDTIDVWRKGQALSFAEITERWHEAGWLVHLTTNVHLVVTGGEPLLQQRALGAFLAYLFESGIQPTVEIETNATIVPSAELDAHVSQYNCSPKGVNSGNTKAKRHNVAAMRAFADSPKAVFKFVVSTREDVKQIEAEYLIPYDINRSRVWLMPASETMATLQQKEQLVFSLCQDYRYNYSTRLQLQVWDQATGV